MVVSAVVAGLVLGLSGGILPGPLLALVIQQTLRFGTREGIVVASTPLLTDLPVLVGALVALRQLNEAAGVLGVVAIAGAGFLVCLGCESFTAASYPPRVSSVAPRSITRGMTANLLNPNVYVFWLTVGAPTVNQAWTAGPLHAVGFLVAMYGSLVGSKMLIAVLVGRGAGVLTSRLYHQLLRVLGLALFLFAALLFWDGLQRLWAVFA